MLVKVDYDNAWKVLCTYFTLQKPTTAVATVASRMLGRHAQLFSVTYQGHLAFYYKVNLCCRFLSLEFIQSNF